MINQKVLYYINIVICIEQSQYGLPLNRLPPPSKIFPPKSVIVSLHQIAEMCTHMLPSYKQQNCIELLHSTQVCDSLLSPFSKIALSPQIHAAKLKAARQHEEYCRQILNIRHLIHPMGAAAAYTFQQ